MYNASRKTSINVGIVKFCCEKTNYVKGGYSKKDNKYWTFEFTKEEAIKEKKIVIKKLSDEQRKINLKESRKKYCEKNKEKIRENNKKYIYKNKEKVKEYRIKNKEKIIKYQKKYIEKNKDKLKNYQKNYIEKNKDKVKEYRKNYDEKNKNKIRCEICNVGFTKNRDKKIHELTKKHIKNTN